MYQQHTEGVENFQPVQSVITVAARSHLLFSRLAPSFPRFPLNFPVIKIPDKNRHLATRFVVKILHENRQNYYRQIILYCLTSIGEEGANSHLQYNVFNLTRTKM